MATSPAVHIIDDDEAVRDSLAILLEAHGLAAVAYASAREFLERSEPGDDDCVVTDVMMPDIDGLALLRALKAWPKAPPVIVVAGRSGEALVDAAEVLGAFAVIDKPFAAETLLAAVRAAMAGEGRP